MRWLDYVRQDSSGLGVEKLEILSTQEPHNARYLESLAHAYCAKEQLDDAVHALIRRISLPAASADFWRAYYELGLIRLAAGCPREQIEEALHRARQLEPQRAEALWVLAVYCRERGRHREALSFAATAIEMEEPPLGSVLTAAEQEIYRWRALVEYAHAAWHLGMFEEALTANRRLSKAQLPEWERQIVTHNELCCRFEVERSVASSSTDAVPPSPRLLLNWVMTSAVGHVVEALKLARGYAAANENLQIHVLLNAKAPSELARACPDIVRVYPIDLEEISASWGQAECLKDIPLQWDYIVDAPPRQSTETFHGLTTAMFKARVWRGSVNDRFTPTVRKYLRYRRDQQVRLSLPEEAVFEPIREEKRGRPKIALLLAGNAGPEVYPTLAWWGRLLDALRLSFPEASFAITGQSTSHRNRTWTTAFPRAAVQRLFDHVPDLIDAYDIGLWAQLALLRDCDVLIAPHTGFAFLAPCVGTPWLALSGGMTPEYLFNGAPFACVLPACPRYPCFSSMLAERRDKYGSADDHSPGSWLSGRYECMSERALDPRIPEVVAAVKRLCVNEFDYVAAIRAHREKVKESSINHRALYVFDATRGWDRFELDAGNEQ